MAIPRGNAPRRLLAGVFPRRLFYSELRVGVAAGVAELCSGWTDEGVRPYMSYFCSGAAAGVVVVSATFSVPATDCRVR
jgi:hypothetical protein